VFGHKVGGGSIGAYTSFVSELIVEGIVPVSEFESARNRLLMQKKTIACSTTLSMCMAIELV
jgi:hypothetical protein